MPDLISLSRCAESGIQKALDCDDDSLSLREVLEWVAPLLLIFVAQAGFARLAAESHGGNMGDLGGWSHRSRPFTLSGFGIGDRPDYVNSRRFTPDCMAGWNRPRAAIHER